MTIYGYARESTDKQELGLDAQLDLLKESKCERIFTDKGVSGKDNIVDGKAWLELMGSVATGDRIIVTSQSRLGRKNYEVLYAVGKLIEKGASLQVLEENKVYDDLDNFEQNLNLTFRSINDHTERVEISRRTTRSLKHLSDSGVILGRKPKLTNADVDRILALREAGLGYQSISKSVRKEGSDGKLHTVSVNTIKRVFAGSYMTVEAWHEHNDRARASMGRHREAIRRAEAS